jgi:hypothetical protein
MKDSAGTDPQAILRLEKQASKTLIPIDVQGYMPFKVAREETLDSRWIQNVLRDLLGLNQVASSLSPEEQGDLKEYLHRRVTGPHTDAVMVCKGTEECPIVGDCWLANNKKPVPVGKRCPIESYILAAAIIKYTDEMQVGDTDFVDQAILSELAAIELYERRVSLILASSKQSLIDESVVGEDADGEPMTAKHIAYEYDILERGRIRREKLLKSIVGTRYEKYKKKQALGAGEKDPSTDMARTKEGFDKMLEDSRRRALTPSIQDDREE